MTARLKELEESTPVDAKRSFREAFAKAKKAFHPVKASHENPFYHSKYADLSDYHRAIDQALLDNGFTIHQCFDADATGNYLWTKLCHIDGHEEFSRIRLTSKDDSDPQKVGSATTYLRRYSLAALLGIPTEDDDGNTASSGHAGDKQEGPFRFPFGKKYIGKTFDEAAEEFGREELDGFIKWIVNKNDPRNQHIVDAYQAWCNLNQ